jgi:hypothetical protein
MQKNKSQKNKSQKKAALIFFGFYKSTRFLFTEN